MDGIRLLHSLGLRNFLSFGDPGVTVPLEPLNVLIGPNCSGKSNLIEAIGLLQAAPKDLMAPIREGGGVAEWLWKAPERAPAAEVVAIAGNPRGKMPLRYKLSFSSVGQRFEVVDEAIENERPHDGMDDVYFYYRYQDGHPAMNIRITSGDERGEHSSDRVRRSLRKEDLSPQQSVLSQRKDPDQYPEITYLGDRFADIRMYRDWNFGRYTAPRLPQKPDLPEDFLLEDASNLGLVLNDLQHRPGVGTVLLSHLQFLYENVEAITTRIHGGTVQVFVHERGLKQPVPATRLSDGLLRYLCLLSVLCHPEPPPLVCMEEPELGLHPDVLPRIAELLVDASQRMQLVVTTHSDVLVSALSETVGAIVVCERDEGGSRLRRLDPEELGAWLDQYSLGELWRMGEIGGTR